MIPLMGERVRPCNGLKYYSWVRDYSSFGISYIVHFLRFKKIFGTLYSRQKEEKGGSQWWSCRSNYHRNQHFLVTPTNIWIIEIMPSSRASNFGKWLCANFLMFDKTYHFMKSTCIYCVILTMALCSLPFPRFLGRKWKWRRADLGLFQIQPRAPHPAGDFQNSFLLQRIVDPLALWADHTEAPCKNCWQLPSAAILLEVFFAYTSMTSSANWTTTKTASRNKMSIKFYIQHWTVKNVRTKTMVTPCQDNCAKCVYVLFRSILKSAPVAVQYYRLRVDYLSKTKFPPICRLFWGLQISFTSLEDWKSSQLRETKLNCTLC